MSDLERYSAIESGFRREFLLLQGKGCRWHRCTFCDYWLDDGSFLKIDAINLGYTLDLRKWTRYIQSAKLYLTIRDLAVFTNYNGLNPEVDINGLYPGFEYVNDTASMYPQTTRFTLGVQITF